MKTNKLIIGLFCSLIFLAGCQKDLFNDVSFLNSVSSSAKLTALYDITQNNTGVVTITPNGEGVTYFEVYYGDNTTTPVKVLPGKNTVHQYAEGVYKVKIVGYNSLGAKTEATQDLTVSFRAPENLKATLTQNGLALTVDATALYETYFKVFFGDSNNVTPIPFKTFIEGQPITYTYAKAGTYDVKVVALSGGAASSQVVKTIKVGKQIDLPIGFDDVNYDYTFGDFGGAASSIAADPADAANKVMKVVKTAGAEVWAGTTMSTSLGLAKAIPLKSGASTMRARVYSPAAGIKVKLKVEDHNNGNISVETDAVTTVANAWEVLEFKFANQSAGTPAVNYANNYDKASIFFDFGKGGSGKVFYCDDVMMKPAAVVLSQINLPVTFDATTVNYTMTDFGNNSTVDAVDPTSSSNKVKKTTKVNGAETWAGTTIGTPAGFASKIPITSSATKMSVRVYSPAVGIKVKLKIEDKNDPNKSVETDVLTTKANEWETMAFDFSNQSTGTAALNTSYTYDKASIFFDFGNAGSGKVFYWDDVQFGVPANANALVLPLTFESSTINYAFTNFDGGAVTIVNNPASGSINTSAKVAKMVKGAGQSWGGSYITLDSRIDFSTNKTFKVKVYSPRVGAKLLLKVENLTDYNIAFDKEVATTKANEWEEITFDYSSISTSNSYQKIVLIFDLGTVGDGSANFTFYFDDIKLN
ncbi:MAG: hypothetical protein ACKO52_00900 [Sediminibacterium sp.]